MQVFHARMVPRQIQYGTCTQERRPAGLGLEGIHAGASLEQGGNGGVASAVNSVVDGLGACNVLDCQRGSGRDELVHGVQLAAETGHHQPAMQQWSRVDLMHVI